MPRRRKRNSMNDAAQTIRDSLKQRFGEDFAVDDKLAGLDELARIAAHRVHRKFLDQEIAPDLLRLLCACALSAPSKSDLQQADILVVRDRAKVATITSWIPDMPWIASAPVFLVFLADGRRLKRIFELRERPFPN